MSDAPPQSIPSGPPAAGPPPVSTSPAAELAEKPPLALLTLRTIAGDAGLRRVAISGLLLLLGWIVAGWGAPRAAQITLLVGAGVLASVRTGPKALESLRRFQLSVDVLMFAAAIGAWAIGHYVEGTFLLFLFGLGNAGERLALSRAHEAVKALGSLAPDTAHLLSDSVDAAPHTIPVADVAVNQRIRVLPYERIPLDGLVEVGNSAVDESTLTGESVPIDKGPADPVFAGTLNTSGVLEVRVTRIAGESTLARIMRMVEEAQAAKSPTQQFTERIERWYVPAVFIGAGLLLALPPLLAGGEWNVWIYRALAFLTAASPCALALGTPAAVLCGIARAARLGVLVKGGGHLEVLGRVRSIAFDKTGTLTVGRPRVVSIGTSAGMSEDDALAHAAAIESQITHPLAKAIVSAATQLGLAIPIATDVEQLAGRGARGVIQGANWSVVKPAVFAADAWPDDLRAALASAVAAGQTMVVLAMDDRPRALLRLSDEIRADAAAALAKLRELGITDQVMLTGDHTAVAQGVARELGLSRVFAELHPDEKLEQIGRLRETSGPVAMVGDGVNDAPALAAADVGVAMGAAGAEVALETADVALLGNSLERLPTAILLARASNRLIRQNLIFSIAVICVVAPLAALGLAHLGVAVVMHEGSTVVVVLNALRLLRFRPDVNRA